MLSGPCPTHPEKGTRLLLHALLQKLVGEFVFIILAQGNIAGNLAGILVDFFWIHAEIGSNTSERISEHFS